MSDRLFISYSTRDSARVGEVVTRLRDLGVEVWLDQSQISASDNIVARIDEGLSNTKYFVLFASESYFSSSWALAEYRAAFYAAIGANERKIIVVLLDDTGLPPLIASNRHVRYTTPDKVADEIAHAIQATDLTQSATEASDPEAKPRPNRQVLQWEMVQDHVIRSLIPELLRRRGDMMSARSEVVQFDLPLSGGSTISFNIAKAFLQDDVLFFDLQAELHNLSTVSRIAASLRKRLLQGGLGVFEAPFEVELEERQGQLAGINNRLREQLRALVPDIFVYASSLVKAKQS